MAIGTAAERRRAVGVSLFVLPAPAAGISDDDKTSLLWLYFTPVEVEAPAETADTLAELYTLLQAPDLEVEFGADLLDADETELIDISDDLESFEVTRNIFRSVHGTCRFKVARQLQWQRQRVRPWITISSASEDLTATWTMGVWVPGIPDRTVGKQPETYDVEGADKLILLDTPCGRTYSVESGEAPVAKVEAILADEVANAGSVSIDQTSASTVVSSTTTWTADVTWLRICNELLAMVGYEGLSCDRDGAFTSRPSTSPAARPVSWEFDSDDEALSIVGVDRTWRRDVLDIPNVWVFVRRNVDSPVDGSGRVELTNQSDGDTSIDARGGRVVRVVVESDAVDDTALATLAENRKRADMDVAAKLSLTTGLVPLLWHLDVVRLSDASLGGVSRWAVEEWSLDLSGRSEMSHRWRQVA